MLGIISLSVGIIFGFLTSLMFKHFRFLTQSPITETFVILAMSLISYFASYMIVIVKIEMSGIISLLTCGIIQSHYTWYNLSPQGKQTSTVVAQFLGSLSEAGVYSYVGIALYSQIPTWWSFTFIAIMFAIIVIGRILAVFSTFYASRLCCKRRTINFNELCFITYGGMIRGAIAFALVLNLPECTPSQSIAGDT